MPRRPSAPSELPGGFIYRPDFLTESEETELLQDFRALTFEVFDFHGYKAKRRVIEYGWEYDFDTRNATAVKPIPDFLLPFRGRAAALSGVEPEELVEAVITQYTAGAPIGWHRDVPQFEIIVGISLASSCRMRLKPYKAEGKLVSVILEPRSAYVIRGDARWKYQHSIPAVEKLRYSITFRTLRAKKQKDRASMPAA
jgi:alkylated DNA repair dioxygenase AlkB